MPVGWQMQGGILGILALIACEPSSATDKEAHRQEIAVAERAHRFWYEYELLHQDVDRRFAARFKGQIAAGVGCDVCPSLCKIADLRPMRKDIFQDLFRRAARRASSDAEYRDILLAIRELERLGCVAASDGDARLALLGLLDSAESRPVRYRAALLARDAHLASDEAHRVLGELARGTDEIAGIARMHLASDEAD